MRLLVLSFLASSLILGSHLSADPGTAFTYQAQLRNAGEPVEGTVGLSFTLYDDATSGTQVGAALVPPDRVLRGGLVSESLDFGVNVFSGERRWLEIALDSDGGGDNYQVLLPRVELLPSPYAMYSELAGTALNDAVNDADADPTNELQTFELNGNSLSLSDGNTIDLTNTGTVNYASGTAALDLNTLVGTAIPFSVNFQQSFPAAPSAKSTGTVPASSFNQTSSSTTGFTAEVSLAAANDPDGGPENRGAWSSLALIDGLPAISYIDSDNNNVYLVRALDDVGYVWDEPVLVNGDGNREITELFSVDFNSTNKIVSVISRHSISGQLVVDIAFSGDLDFSLFQGNIKTPIDSDGLAFAFVGGNPALAYPRGGDLIFVNARDTFGTNWNDPEITVAGASMGGDSVGKFVDLAIVDGFPALVYHNETTSELTYQRASNAGGTTWGTPVSLGTWSPISPACLFVTDERPAVAYADGGALYFLISDNALGTAWSGIATVVGTAASSGDRIIEASVIGGVPVIAYRDASDALQYIIGADAQGSSFGSPIALDGMTTIGGSLDLLEINGGPAVSFARQDGETNLAYRHAPTSIDWEASFLPHDTDPDETNEIQLLSWDSPELSISQGNTVNIQNLIPPGSDGHSLDADDGDPEDSLYVNANGFVGISTRQAQAPLHVAGQVEGLETTDIRTLSSIGRVNQMRVTLDGIVFWGYNGGLRVLDASGPGNPIELANIPDAPDGQDFDAISSINGMALDEAESLLYVTSFDESALSVIDVSVLTTPILITKVVDGENGFNYLESPREMVMDTDRDLLFSLSLNSNALSVIDVSDPSNPQVVGTATDLQSGFENITSPTQIAIDGEIIYISSFNDSVTPISIADPTAPDALSYFPRTITNPAALEVQDDLLFVASPAQSVILITDVTVPSSPNVIYEITNSDPGISDLGSLRELTVDGDFLYYSTNPGNGVDGTVVVVDISDPLNPVGIETIVDDSMSAFSGLLFRPEELTVLGRDLYIGSSNDQTLTILSKRVDSLTAIVEGTLMADRIEGEVFEGAFIGDGSGLTNLPVPIQEFNARLDERDQEIQRLKKKKCGA